MRVRYLRSTDIARCVELWPAIAGWGDGAPAALAELVQEGRIRGVLFEADARDAPLAFGWTAFVRNPFIRQYAALPTPPLAASVLRATMAGEAPLLDDAGIANASADDDLHLLVLAYRQQFRAADDPRAHEMLRVGYDAYRLLNEGYHLRGVWQEGDAVDEPVLCGGGYLPKCRYGADTLFGCERDDLTAPWPSNITGQLLIARPAQLRLTPAQRRVAYLALWQLSDDDVAQRLQLSSDTVRRHWRGIFERTAERLPHLFEVPDASRARTARGPEKRRHVLEYLRQHLHELRPPGPLPSPEHAHAHAH